MEKTIHDGLVNRRSIRKFSSREVPTELIKDIVKDARWAPSWANAQPWKLYVAVGHKAKEIREACQKGEAGPRGVEMPYFSGERWGMKESRNMDHWGRQLQQFIYPGTAAMGEAQRTLFDAPAIAYITVHRRSPLWEILDAGAFEQSLLLSAYNHGVDTIVAYAFAEHSAFVKEKLEIPDDEIIVMGIGMGYRTDDKINQFKSDRENLDDMLFIRS